MTYPWLMEQFLRCDENGLYGINVRDIVYFDASRLEKELILTISTTDSTAHDIHGVYAIEAAMVLCPSLLESMRFRWVRNAWMIHNLIGHPIMQVLAWLKLYKQALWIHDTTIPKPLRK